MTSTMTSTQSHPPQGRGDEQVHHPMSVPIHARRRVFCIFGLWAVSACRLCSQDCNRQDPHISSGRVGDSLTAVQARLGRFGEDEIATCTLKYACGKGGSLICQFSAVVRCETDMSSCLARAAENERAIRKVAVLSRGSLSRGSPN